MKPVSIFLLLFLFSFQSRSQVFSDNFNGFDSIWSSSGNLGVISDFYNDHDSVLYIGGVFRYVNNSTAYGICSWNGDSVTTYGSGTLGNGSVEAITVYKNVLYIGGDFFDFDTNPDWLATWNGSNWQTPPVIGGPDSHVYDFVDFNDTLFFCGLFGHLDGMTFGKIAAFDGTDRHNVGSMGVRACALEVFNGELYVGGNFGLRRYLGGTSWETFPVQPNDFVFELKTDTFNNFLYVGGQFNHIGNEPSSGAAMWDGFKWNAMGDYCGATVWPQAMVVYQGDLYTGGGYVDIGNGIRTFITRWDGEQWDSIGGAFNNGILAMELFRNEIYIGGFDTCNGVRTGGMVKLTVPDNGCNYIKPRVYTLADTFYLSGGQAPVQFYNNNPYVDTWSWDFGDAGTGTIKDPLHTYTDTGDYTAQVTVTHNGCIKTAEKTIHIALGTGIEETIMKDFRIFPNPGKDVFNVQVELPENAKAELKITGINGGLKKIVTIKTGTTQINTGGWAKGTYLCNLFVNGRLVKTEKIVVSDK